MWLLVMMGTCVSGFSLEMPFLWRLPAGWYEVSQHEDVLIATTADDSWEDRMIDPGQVRARIGTLSTALMDEIAIDRSSTDSLTRGLYEVIIAPDYKAVEYASLSFAPLGEARIAFRSAPPSPTYVWAVRQLPSGAVAYLLAAGDEEDLLRRLGALGEILKSITEER